ncbi:hypothetical protein K4L44_04690 [Halosquirtibacter laminarini]|uniref:Uncharacterized protein n=1 Tax=Halosquirtibacter laminarini TaxID=3374600 RepID=A0AC61NQ40_9BACT|nr:hypothetical protein K4L44_04690 [Prolixibacteraceae bacterium]
MDYFVSCIVVLFIVALMEEIKKKLDLILETIAKEKTSNQYDHIEQLKSHMEKSQELFEKKQTYISAGALAISLTLTDKILKFSTCDFKWIIIAGWVMLALSLVLNLVSHFVVGEISSSLLKMKSDEINLLSRFDDENDIYKVSVRLFTSCALF